MANRRRSSTLGKQFVCKLCEASFPYPSKLKRHLRSRKHLLLESSKRAHDDANSIAVDSALEDNVSCRCHFLQMFSCMHVSIEQEMAVSELLGGKDVFVVLPTGYSKLLCYACFPDL